jgi:excisionase family DNA binding protein
MKDILIKDSVIRERLMTRKEVAAYFGVSKETIRRWEGQGKITPIVLNARVYRYRPSDLEALIGSC